MKENEKQKWMEALARRIAEKPEILDEIRQRLESEDIEDWDWDEDDSVGA